MAAFGAAPALALGAVGAALAVGAAAPWPGAAALLATVALALIATAVAGVLGTVIALYLHTLADEAELGRGRTSLRLAGATPPVVAGWFAGAVVAPGLGVEGGWLLAGVTLGLWCTPRFALRALRVFTTRHAAVYDDALGLGVGPVSAAWRVLLPVAAGDLAAVAVGIGGRAGGEAMVALLAAGASRPLAVAALTEPGSAAVLAGLGAALAVAARRMEAR